MRAVNAACTGISFTSIHWSVTQSKYDKNLVTMTPTQTFGMNRINRATEVKPALNALVMTGGCYNTRDAPPIKRPRTRVMEIFGDQFACSSKFKH